MSAGSLEGGRGTVDSHSQKSAGMRCPWKKVLAKKLKQRSQAQLIPELLTGL